MSHNHIWKKHKVRRRHTEVWSENEMVCSRISWFDREIALGCGFSLIEKPVCYGFRVYNCEVHTVQIE